MTSIPTPTTTTHYIELAIRERERDDVGAWPPLLNLGTKAKSKPTRKCLEIRSHGNLKVILTVQIDGQR